MSDAKKCDRCGKYYIRNKNTSLRYEGETVDYIKLDSAYRNITGRCFDLCNDCVHELFDFLHISNEPLIREDRLQNYMFIHKRIDMPTDDFLNRIYDLNTDEKAEFLKRCHEETNYGVNSTGDVYKKRDIDSPVCREEED
ncbi:hypothetical protein DWV75_02375 [Ruminococcus sp. AF12-5]|jgi:hypothetical protein|nr:hypothetical protein DWV75_02375 [Ruminococcus sp. AF12-5]